MFMMHSTAHNLSDRYRISIDTRYQPKDERFFFGEDGTWLGNLHHKGTTYNQCPSCARSGTSDVTAPVYYGQSGDAGEASCPRRG